MTATFLTTALFLAAGLQASGPPVLMPQVPSGLAARAAPPPSRATTAGIAPGTTVPRAVIEGCRRAELGAASPPAGVDCPALLRAVEAELRRTPEGSLLRLLGEQSSVTQREQVRSVDSADANSVARAAANGSAQGDAAAVAAQQRAGSSPPAGGPR